MRNPNCCSCCYVPNVPGSKPNDVAEAAALKSITDSTTLKRASSGALMDIGEESTNPVKGGESMLQVTIGELLVSVLSTRFLHVPRG